MAGALSGSGMLVCGAGVLWVAAFGAMAETCQLVANAMSLHMMMRYCAMTLMCGVSISLLLLQNCQFM